MFELKDYCRVKSLEQADDLLHRDKKNVILGGLLWMRMGTRQFHTGIDLTGLDLDRIKERDGHVDIGAMTSLRQVETSPLLLDRFGPVLKDAVSPIVGVQFRNLATVGGSVFSRFSFSDLTTALLVLNTRVHLFRGGAMDLADFLEAPPGRDILVRLSIPVQDITTGYLSVRKSATDLPVLSLAVSCGINGWQIAVGSRPSRARLASRTAKALPAVPGPSDLETACHTLTRELKFGSNARAGREYREHLAKILLKRGVAAICSSTA